MDLMEVLFNNRIFGLALSLGMFLLGKLLFDKTKFPLFNPLLTSGTAIIIFLQVFKIPLKYFNEGSSMIEFFLAPATVLLAVPLYKQFPLLKKYYLPILVGGFVGAITAVLTVYFGGKLLGIDKQLILSFVPKSITTPFGIEVSKMIGGIPSLTVFSIVVTGITGNIIAVQLYKIMGDLHPVAKGIGIGVSSHVGGTSKAVEMGEVEGAMSALAIVVAGLITIILLQIFKGLL